MQTSTLPKDAKARKELPIATGFVDYFPDAMAAVAELSRVGNDQHNPGKPLHWDRSKSGDESDALMRHFVERGTVDTDGVRHSAKVAWRAMALLQKEIEAERKRHPKTEDRRVTLTDRRATLYGDWRVGIQRKRNTDRRKPVHNERRVALTYRRQIRTGEVYAGWPRRTGPKDRRVS